MRWLKHHLVTGLILLGLVLLAAIVLAFLLSLEKSNHGEIAGALGNVLGGTIGALGSAAAVYLMLKAQRNDEMEKTSAAVLREVAELCKSPVGQLGALAGIQTGQVRVPKSELRQLFHTPTPTIYPAIVDRINRLPRPTLVVTFYMQLQETMGLVTVLEKSEPRNEIVTGAHIQVLADLLISQQPRLAGRRLRGGCRKARRDEARRQGTRRQGHVEGHLEPRGGSGQFASSISGIGHS
jgi:hypothetical protein